MGKYTIARIIVIIFFKFLLHKMITHCMFKWLTSSLRLCNYAQLGRKSWIQLTFAISQQLVAASMRMCDLYIQVNNLIAGYWFVDDFDARVNEVLDMRRWHVTLWKFASCCQKSVLPSCVQCCHFRYPSFLVENRCDYFLNRLVFSKKVGSV